MSLCARVLSIKINGVEQAVTGGSLGHSRGEKNKESALNAVDKSIFFDLALSYCLTWLGSLVEIMGDKFFNDLVITFSAYQTTCRPLVVLLMGVRL